MEGYSVGLVLLSLCCAAVKAQLSIAYNSTMNYGSHTYYYVVTPTDSSYYWQNFYEAEQECVDWGGHLASVHSQDEFDFLIELVTEKALTYIGENGNTWTDGTSNDFTAWKTQIAPHARLTYKSADESKNYSLPAFVCKKALTAEAITLSLKQAAICGTSKDDCSQHATCTNTGLGAYTCSCNNGYSGEGKTCEEIKICGTSQDDCNQFATCANTGPGTHSCTCKNGYSGNGKSCEEIKICGTSQDDCSQFATCANTGPGTHSCTCKNGYSGNGKSCEEIKICGTSQDDCSSFATCANTGPGTYKCTCKSGYTGNGKTCTKESDYTKTTYYSGYLYHYVVSPTNKIYFNTAESNCKKWGGHLASIHSEKELNFVKGLVTKNYKTFVGWGVYRWTDGTSNDYPDFYKNIGPWLIYQYMWSNSKHEAYICKKKFTIKFPSFSKTLLPSW